MNSVLTRIFRIAVLITLLSCIGGNAPAQPAASGVPGKMAADAESGFVSSNLPIIIINTHGYVIMDSPKTAADFAVIDNGPGKRNAVTDSAAYRGRIGIELRGSSSQSFPKKSYGLETWDIANASIDTALLQMPPESDWVLNANYTDKSLMRNALAYQVWTNLGHYASRYRFVELLLNNDYQGIYVFSEKIKRDKNRLDISKLRPDENFGDALTGGYIFKIDKNSGSGGYGWFSSYLPDAHPDNQTIFFQYEYPKYDEISASQKSYIRNYVLDFESALKSASFADPAAGYRRYADEYSFIDYFIVNEISKNVDGYRLSTFLHKDRDSKGGKLKMGPVWDYDLAWHNADYCDGDKSYGWAYQFPCAYDYWQVPFWWNRLLSDPRYAGQLKCRWTDLRKNTLSNEWFTHYIDSVAGELNEAQVRNFARWPILGIYVWPNPYPLANTYQEEVNNMKSWLTSRLQWLDAYMPGLCNPLSAREPSAAEKAFIIGPNPSFGEVYIESSTILSGRVQISLFDQQGRVLTTKNCNASANVPLQETLNISAYAPGIYLIRITEGRNIFTRRIVKK